MKRFRMYCALILALLVLISCTACGSDDELVSVTDAVVTDPTETDPPETIAPTEEPTEPTEPPLGAGPGSHILSYHSDTYNDYLDYYIHVPQAVTTGMPLMVFLHGDGEVNRIDLLPEGGISQIVDEIYGDSFPFILLEPNTRIESWTKGDIPELLFELINAIADEYCVNTDKIILTGFSRGGMGVWDMISIYGGFFSAAVPVSSPHQKGHIDYIKAAEVPVWTFAGSVGDIERWYHQYLAQNVDIINGCKGFGKFTVLYGCNHVQAKYAAYVEETFKWMLAQQRGVIPEV